MKAFHIFLLIIAGTVCFGQDAETELKTFEDKEIGWTITYPTYLRVLTDEEVAAYEGRGQEAIEETLDEEVETYHKNLIWLYKDRFNSFNSNSQPYNVETDGPYEETQKLIMEVLLETYKNQGIEYDAEFGTYEIDGLTFNMTTTTLYTPDRQKVILNQIIFDRLFGGTRTLTLNINYNNPMDQDILMEVIDSSKLTIRD